MEAYDRETLKDIRRWYHQHGLPYEEEDWGQRDVNGESIGPQHEKGERTREVRSTESTPGRMEWWARQTFPWRPRTHSEQEWAEALEDFFAPYLAMLPRPKGNLVRQVLGDGLTYAEVGRESGVSRQGVQQAVQRAVQDVTRRIAEDDPMYRPPIDGRKRDYEEERRAARRVFVVYLSRRGLESDSRT